MIIYTSCFGGYDKNYFSADIRYDEIYDPYSGSSNHLSSRLNAKKYKVLNPDSLSLWIDSSIEILNREEFENLFEGDFSLIRHPFHNNLKEELDACFSKGYVNPKEREKIRDLYENSGLQLEETPVYACTILYRTEMANKINQMWWELISLYSYRDQLTFPYVINQFKDIDFRVVDLDLYNNDYFVVNTHN